MSKPPYPLSGSKELRKARSAGFPLFLAVALFSAVVNLLMLTGPLFMLQVYDRVLASRSVETLTALFVLVVFLFLLMGVVDLARNRVTQRIAARFQDRMEGRVFTAALREGDLAAALEALEGLPAEAGQAMAPWTERARARLSALTAAETWRAELLGAN